MTVRLITQSMPLHTLENRPFVLLKAVKVVRRAGSVRSIRAHPVAKQERWRGGCPRCARPEKRFASCTRAYDRGLGSKACSRSRRPSWRSYVPDRIRDVSGSGVQRGGCTARIPHPLASRVGVHAIQVAGAVPYSTGPWRVAPAATRLTSRCDRMPIKRGSYSYSWCFLVRRAGYFLRMGQPSH